jgi:uncharacterized protein
VRIWVDCTAAAHPIVLRPLIERFSEQGHEVSITAREYGQTLGLLERLGLPYEAVGAHGGSAAPSKALAVARRSAALIRWARPKRFDLALAHGSVDAAVVATTLRLPLVEMQDYEHAGLQRQLAFRASRLVVVPDAIPVEAMRRAGAAERKLFRYPGLKEDYYLAGFEPDRSILSELAVDEERVLAVVRPPPETSAYHAPNSLYAQVIERLAGEDSVFAIVIPRTEGQREELARRAAGNIVVPERAIDAQSLIAFADLVVSAGGTMNREAVALGTPVWTIFSGRMGAVDEELIASGDLRVLVGADDLGLVKRTDPVGVRNPRDPQVLVDAVLEAA